MPQTTQFSQAPYGAGAAAAGALGRTGRPRSSISFIACEIGMCIAPVESLNGCGGFNSTSSEYRNLVMSTASFTCRRGSGKTPRLIVGAFWNIEREAGCVGAGCEAAIGFVCG